MTRRRDISPVKLSKHARSVVRAVLAAEGTWEVTANGHLKITGPTGVAYVGVHRCSYRGARNAASSIKRYSGLDIRL